MEKYSYFMLIKSKGKRHRILTTYNESMLYNENLEIGDKICILGNKNKFEDIPQEEFTYIVPEYYYKNNFKKGN
jgi:hypothetical protein